MTRPAVLTDRHTMFVGWITGLALEAGLPVEPVVDYHGTITNHLRVPMTIITGDPADRWTITLTIIVPEPPDDWLPDGWTDVQ